MRKGSEEMESQLLEARSLDAREVIIVAKGHAKSSTKTRHPNALRFCCRGVRRSRASQSRIYLARLRRAHAPVSSKRGLGG